MKHLKHTDLKHTTLTDHYDLIMEQNCKYVGRQKQEQVKGFHRLWNEY